MRIGRYKENKMGIFSKIFGNYSDKELKRLRPIADQVMSLEQKYASMSDLQLREMTEAFKKQIADGMSLDTILPDAFAVCREASGRVLGMKPVSYTHLRAHET